MEPVPVTRRVRRTVRVAVALVIGQALLYALIGWLTLGHSRSEPHRPAAPVDQLAAPPLVPAPTATVTRSAIAASKQPRRPSSATPGRLRATTAPAAPARRTTAPTKPPVPISVPPADAVPPPVPIAPSPPASPAPALPGPTSEAPRTPLPSGTSGPPSDIDPVGGEIQQPVVVGVWCRPQGAFVRTAEGELVR